MANRTLSQRVNNGALAAPVAPAGAAAHAQTPPAPAPAAPAPRVTRPRVTRPRVTGPRRADSLRT